VIEHSFVGRHEIDTFALDPRIPKLLYDTGR
jgi:hypothetical protein